MARKTVVVLLVGLALASVHLAEAQQSKKVRIGCLAGSSSSADAPRVEALRQGLRDLGHVEGKNITMECRYADGKFDKLPPLAEELIRLKVDVLVTIATPAAQAARNATGTIPIVFFSCGRSCRDRTD